MNEEKTLGPWGDMDEDAGAGQECQEAGGGLEDKDDGQGPPERGHRVTLSKFCTHLILVTVSLLVTSQIVTLSDFDS